jgi:hypothetical protein
MPEPGKGEEGTEQQVEENAPDPLDYYDRVDTSKAEKIAGVGGSKTKEARGEPSKFQRYLEHAKESISRAKAIGERATERVGERYPRTREIPRLVKEFARAEDGKDVRAMASLFLSKEAADELKQEVVEHAAKAAVRQGIGSTVPGWGNAGMAAYSIYDFGKSVKQFIDENKLKPQNEIKPARPLHEVAQEQREAKLKQLDVHGELNRQSKIAKFHEQHPNAYLMMGGADDRLQSQINQVNKQSVEELISKRASESKGATQIASHLTKAQNVSQSFQRNYLVGSVFENYNHVLATVHKELGEHHFDLVHHPQRGMEFDRFASEWLYAKGFSKSEVHSAITNHSPFRQLLYEPQHSFQKPGYHPLLQEHDTKILSTLESDLAHVRSDVQKWQLSIGSDVAKAHISPHEFNDYKILKAQNLSRAEVKKDAVDRLSREVLAEYMGKNAQDNDQGAALQYLLERGRVLQAGKQPDDLYITFKLHAAGHDKAEVIDVLHQFSPGSNDGVHYGHQQYQQLEQFLKHPDAQATVEHIAKTKQKDPVLQYEHRLDRLGLSHDQYEGKVQSPSFTDKPNSATLTRSQDSREIDIER